MSRASLVETAREARSDGCQRWSVRKTPSAVPRAAEARCSSPQRRGGALRAGGRWWGSLIPVGAPEHREMAALVLRLCRAHGARPVVASRFFFSQRCFVTPDALYARTGRQGDRGRDRAATGGCRLRPGAARSCARGGPGAGRLPAEEGKEPPTTLSGRRPVPKAHHHAHKPPLSPTTTFFCPGGCPSVARAPFSVPARRPVCGGALRPGSPARRSPRCMRRHENTAPRGSM